MTTEYAVREMHQGDGCAHLIERACFPGGNLLGQEGILDFLRHHGNFGLVTVEYQHADVQRDAYDIAERRTNGFQLPYDGEAAEKDWQQALQKQLAKCAFVLVSRSPHALVVERICVQPDLQRKRFGTRLLLAIAKRLPNYGLNRIMAMVGLNHDCGQQFFHSRCFSRTRHKLSGLCVFERTFEAASPMRNRMVA